MDLLSPLDGPQDPLDCSCSLGSGGPGALLRLPRGRPEPTTAHLGHLRWEVGRAEWEPWKVTLASSLMNVSHTVLLFSRTHQVLCNSGLFACYPWLEVPS